MGTVNVNVCERDFVALWDGSVKRRSLSFASAYKSEVMDLDKEVVL